MQLFDFLTPVPEKIFNTITDTTPRSLVNVIDIYTKQFPDLDGVDLAIIGVKDDRQIIHLS